MSEDPLRLLIVGSGPAGGTAATVAASLGAEVTLVEDTVVGGAAHLLDCVPSKAMVASAMRMHAIANAARLGLAGGVAVEPDMRLLSARADDLSGSLAAADTSMLESQQVRLINGRARFTGTTTAAVATTDGGSVDLDFDNALIATGSSPWIPDWAEADGERVITTRHAYHLPEVPKHVIVIGSGVTGVEFVHIFSALGSEVTLLVSRQQVLPHRDPEVAAVLEEDFLERGVKLLKGSRADGARTSGDGVVVTTEDGRAVEGSHALLAVGSLPNSSGLGLEQASVEADERGYIIVDEFQRTTADNIYAAGDVTGQMLLSSVAALQGRAVARHVMGRGGRPVDYAYACHAIFTEPEIASVGLEEVDAASLGRKVRITKLPFAANSRALIQGNPRGFVKVISDPATRTVLGGTIVGHHASELIAILALAAKARLTVDAVAETLMVYPSLAESLMEAAD
jgi:dihydrolipoamide dehydrogenase